VQATRGQRHDDVARAHPIRSQRRGFFHGADDETREIVVGRRVQAGHLGGFPADECAGVLPTAGGDARHHRLGHNGIEDAERDVVEKKERQRTLRENVVHAVVHEAVANGIVPTRLDRDLDLGANAIRTGHQQWLVPGRRAEQSPERAERTDGAGRPRGFHESAISLLRLLGRLDVHTGRPVVHGPGHSSSASSNATR
jgi:hypothetical protein